MCDWLALVSLNVILSVRALQRAENIEEAGSRFLKKALGFPSRCFPFRIVGGTVPSAGILWLLRWPLSATLESHRTWQVCLEIPLLTHPCPPAPKPAEKRICFLELSASG